MQNGYIVNQLNEHTWQIEETNYRIGVWFYLLEGTERAALIDTGLGNIDIKSIVESLTKLPVIIINTHSHGDHTGGNWAYDEIYLHEGDRAAYERTARGEGPGGLPRPIHEKFIPIKEGDEIELGGRTLRIYHTPGHSAGSISILDVQNRILYTGDTGCRGEVLVFEKDIGLAGYQKTLQKILDLGDLYDLTYPAHCTSPTEKRVIERLVALADDILAGKVEEREFVDPHFKGYVCADRDEIGFMYPPIER